MKHKAAYLAVMLCLTVFVEPAIFLAQNAIEVLHPLIASRYMKAHF
jgi:hypothetical protein